jgi:hypothetical protein
MLTAILLTSTILLKDGQQALMVALMIALYFLVSREWKVVLAVSDRRIT